jgi:hypothetical protein
MGIKLIQEKRETKNTAVFNNSDDTIQQVPESTDIAQTIKELNDDKVDDKSSFSNIDMKSRLLNIEISSIIALDSLVALDFLPPETSFITRSKKRLSVSQNGEGRKEIVSIAQGMKDQQNGTSVWSKMGNLFKGGSQ